jgi:hypothetical protein
MAPSRLQLASDVGDREGEQCSMGETSCTRFGGDGLKKGRWAAGRGSVSKGIQVGCSKE